MNRHDLVYIQSRDQFVFLDESLPMSVKDKVQQMIARHVPFTVCRQDPLPVSALDIDHRDYGLKVATSCIYQAQKHRIALVLKNTPMHSHQPLALYKVLPYFDPKTQVALDGFIRDLDAINCKVFVYGSYSNQYFSDDRFLHAQSDVDILLWPQDLQQLTLILIKIQRLKSKIDLKVDGELQIKEGQHVSFNELIHALKQQHNEIVVKGFRHISLQNINELLGWMPYEFNLFTKSFT